ncbi:MAG: hypothetical protein RJA70_2957, partial [Pseudomonadota bacterium]
MSVRSYAVSISFVAALLPCSALAADPPDSSGRPRLRVNLPVELTITGAGAALWLTSEVFKGKLAPTTCHWCDASGGDLYIQNKLRWSNTGSADAVSNITAFVLAPIAALGLDAAAVHAQGGNFCEWGEDATVIAESVVVGANLNQVVKFLVGRERPFVHD